MNSKPLLTSAIAILMTATSPALFAATIATDYTKITTSGDYRDINKPGQSYEYTIDLSGIDVTNTSGVELEVTAKGDYGSYNITADSLKKSTTPYEWFTFKLDDTTFADMWGNTTGLNVDYNGFTALSAPSVTLTPNTHDDFVMTAKFSLSDTLFQSLAADGMIIVSWQNGSEVDPYHTSHMKDGGYSDGGEDGVSWTLSANTVSAVPVPMAAWLFTPALVGFMGLRRKANQTQV